MYYTNNEDSEKLVTDMKNCAVSYMKEYFHINLIAILEKDSPNAGSPVQIGTGFLYKFKNQLYLITAHHVLRKQIEKNNFNNTYLSFSTDYENSQDRKVFLTKLGATEKKPYIGILAIVALTKIFHDEENDILIMPLLSEYMGGYNANYTEINDIYLKNDKHSVYIITGFPNSRNKSKIHPGFLEVSSFKILVHLETPDYVSYDKNKIYIDYDKYKISPRGCSGAPLLKVAFKFSPNPSPVAANNISVSIQGYEIKGVLIEYNKRNEKKIVYANLFEVNKLIENNLFM